MTLPMIQPYKTDVAVLMLFFNRPDHFREVFAEVRKARPSRLFLYQDGPREGRDDLPGIMACRDIAADKNIDWSCDVHRHYCDKNQGCDPSEYLSQKWAFSMADKVIVLEDDDVPSQSFFPFCKAMLDRYEHDERVWMVSGFNIDETTPDAGADYFFTSAFSIWGWASWRRVFKTWDEKYTWLDDADAVGKLQALIRQRKLRADFLQMCRDHRATGKEYYESIFWASMLLNSGLAIMPRLNLINNLGLSTDSTHFSSSAATTPRAYRRIFEMKRLELPSPLHHPKYLIDHVAYKERLYRVNAWGHPWIKAERSVEELWLNLRHGNFAVIAKALRRRISKWAGKDKHQ